MNTDFWFEIKNLFNKALDSPAEERKKFLNDLNKKNPEIYKEVISLLNSFENSENFLENPITAANYLNEESEDLYIGKQLGPYKIENKIAEGGMGVVYLGIRTDEQFKKKVAIKLIKGGQSSGYILKRFQNERQTLANLDHPNIAKLLDGGTLEDGNQFFIMEYIDGVQIDTYCDDNKLSINERLKLFQKVCSAVHYAHRNLVIHRDIKPSNILVTKEGEPKLLDFGIAKILENEESKYETILTKTGSWNFTPEYASPEQVKGEKITTSSDIYSLGVLLYKLLSGHHPYKFPSYLPIDVNKIVCETQPEKPSTIIQTTEEFQSKDGINKIINPDLIGNLRNENIEKILKKLSGDIDNIILMALRKEPERRYASVEQFSEDIRRHLVGLPVIARKDTFLYISSRFIKRHKFGVAASIVIFLLFISGILGIIWQANVAAKQRDMAKIEAEKTNRINTFLQNMLASPDPVEEGKDVKVTDILDKAVSKIDSNFEEQPEIKASIRTTIGITYQNLGLYKKAIVQFKKALIARKILYGKFSEKIAESTKNLALAYHYFGDFKKAKTLYEESLNIYHKIDSVNNFSYSEALNDYATLIMDLGEYDRAIKLFKDVIKLDEKIFPGNNVNTAAAYNNLAINLDYKNDERNAEIYYRKAISMDSAALGGNNYILAHPINNLAFIYLKKKNFQEAINLFQRSYNIRKRLLPDNHPELGFAIYNLGCTYWYVKNYDKALNLLYEAIAMWHKNLPSDHPYFGNAYYWIGKIFNSENKPDKSLYYLKESLKIRLKKESENKLLIAKTNFEIGNSLMLESKFEDAEKKLIPNYKIIKDELGIKDLDTKYAVKILTEFYTLWHKPDEAKKYEDLVNN